MREIERNGEHREGEEGSGGAHLGRSSLAARRCGRVEGERREEEARALGSRGSRSSSPVQAGRLVDQGRGLEHEQVDKEKGA